MAAGQLKNAQTVSQHFKSANEHLKKDFILYGEADAEGVTLLKPGRTAAVITGGVEDLAAADMAEPIHLTKKILYTNSVDASGVAQTPTQLAVVNEDGIFDTLVWTTTPAKITSALRSGVFESRSIQNPLAKMIARLGEYKRDVFERSVEDDTVVKHNQDKLAIVDITQDCIAALQSLHYSINNYNGNVTPKENLDAMIQKVAALREAIVNIKQTKVASGDPIAQMHANLDKMINNIEQYQVQLVWLAHSPNATQENVKNLVGSYATPFTNPDNSLQHFLQSQLNDIMSNAVEANYTVSGLFQDTSGLNKIITETQIIGEGFSSQNVDYHNPFKAEHAFDFSGAANADGLVTLDMANFGFSASTKATLARQTALMERVDSGQPLYKPTDVERGYFGLNWRGNPTAPLTWLLNGGKDILGTALDLVYIAGKGVSDAVQRLAGRNPPPVEFPSGYSWLLKKDLSEDKFAALPANNALYKNGDQPVIPHRSLLQRLYSGATTILSRYVIEPMVSVGTIVADEVWRLKTARQIKYDATIGSRPVDETAVALLISQRLSEMGGQATSNAVSQRSLIDSYNQLAGKNHVSTYEEVAAKFAAQKSAMPQAAMIPYRLTPDDPGDFVTWAASFSRDLAAVFTDEIYRGHPIAGLAFTIAASTAAPMALPALGHNLILAAINKNFTIPLAKIFIGDTTGLMPTISTAILQGKIAYLAVDIFNGRNSMMKTGLKALLENPVIATVVAVAAVEFGYLLAHDMDVPWLSQKILDETSKAAFPYFELGLAGAKIAAILVEGTMNLHKEHNHADSDHLADIAIEKVRPEIADAMKIGYMKQHNIDKEKDLTPAQKDEIDQQINDYCSKVKDSLKQPKLAGQISQLSFTISKMLNVPAPANFNGVEPMVHNAASQNELQTFLERREQRHQIAQLDPSVLNERDKYVITNYLAQIYPNDPDYVSSVRTRFAQEPKAGPLGETFKIIFSYPGALVRSAIASVRSIGYSASALFYETAGNAQAAATMRVNANNSLLPVRDLGRKIKNDVGLLVKGTSSLLRTTWSLAGGVLMMPVTIVLSLPAVIISRAAPLKIFSAYNKFVFAPGRVSQAINYGVGSMRDDAGARNLGLVTQDMDARYIGSVVVPGAAKSANVAAGKAVAPGGPVVLLDEAALEKAVLTAMSNAFSKRATLKAFIDPAPASFKQMMDSLGVELAKGQQLEKLYSMMNSKPAFNRDLKAALLEVTNKVKVLDGVNLDSRQNYHDRLIELLQINRREPVNELKNAYASFANFELPKTEPKNAVLVDIYKQLKAAQVALNDLSTVHDESRPRVKVVTDLLNRNHCLSLQSVRQVVRLKKIISEHKKELGSDLKSAQNMLQALELSHKAARTTAYRLAVFEPVMTALARLHPVKFPPPLVVIEPPTATASPSPSPSSRVSTPSPTPPPVPPRAGGRVRFDFMTEKRTVVPNHHLPLGQLTAGGPSAPPLSPPVNTQAGGATHTQVIMPPGLNDGPVRTAIASFVMNALQQAHCDKSARMVLQDMEVCHSVRMNGNAQDTFKISDHWQAFLGNHVTFTSPVRSHAIIPGGVGFDKDDFSVARDVFSPREVEPLQENQSRTHFLLVNSAGAPVEKENAGEYTQRRNGDQTTVTTNKLPPMDSQTQIISENGKTATIPSNEYLLFADKQIQTFINDNGAHTTIDLNGTDESLIAAYMIICEAKGLSYHNKTELGKDIDLTTAVAHVHAQTGNAPGKFITPLYQVDVSQEYNKLKQDLNGAHAANPVFKTIEKIHRGVNVNKSDLQLMSDLVKQTALAATAVNAPNPRIR